MDEDGDGSVNTGSTGIKAAFDPTVQRVTGTTAHGGLPIDAPFISEITPNLWQGGCENGLILPRFFKHLVSLYGHESYKVKHQLISTLNVRMLDSEDQDTGQVDEIARWAAACRKTGPVLIHCQAGLNRSGLIVARVLMLDGLSADEAIKTVRERRSPAAICNPAFEKWLKDHDPGHAFADSLTRLYAPRGRVAHLRRPYAPGVYCDAKPPAPGEWLGTGGQDEYDKAASLPLCKRCEKAAGSGAAS